MSDNNSLSQVLFEIKAQHGEALGRRFDRAAGLFYAGCVCYHGENEWSVESGTHPGQFYTVTFSIAWHCTCEDHTSGRAPVLDFLGSRSHVCKHIVACGLSWLIDNPEPSPAGPQPVISIPAWLVRPVVKDAYLADFGLSDEQLAITPGHYKRMLAEAQRRREALPTAG